MNGFRFDRYHAVMQQFMSVLFGNLKLDQGDPDLFARFYVTQRKAPFALALGQDRILDSLRGFAVDHPHRAFLANDRAGLTRVADFLRRSYPGQVRMLREGTLFFANQPVLDVDGPFGIQMGEVLFEHVVDLFATFSHRALEYKLAASGAEELMGADLKHAIDLEGHFAPNGRPWLSDFSLRRCGDDERAMVAALVARICGFDDTSNMEAGQKLGNPTVGTQAHYLMEYALGLIKYLTKIGRGKEFLDERGYPKHPERVLFEYWLDAHPKGTALLIDTFGIEMGIRHAIEAALSKPERRAALKFVRIDSRYAPAASLYVRRYLDMWGLNEVGIMVTGDVDPEMIRQLRRAGVHFGNSPTYLCNGVGVATKYVAEYERVSGAIFKMTMAAGLAVLKYATGKSTLPGVLQLRRYYAKGWITRQITCLEGEEPGYQTGETNHEDLLTALYGAGASELTMWLNPEELRHHVWENQIFNLVVPLPEFADPKNGHVGLSAGVKQLVAETEKVVMEDLGHSQIAPPKSDYDGCLAEVLEFEKKSA